MFELERVKDVSATRGPWKLKVTWADGSNDMVDLTGARAQIRAFQRL